MGFFSFLKSGNRVNDILNKYYKNFGRKPYISPDRNFDQWEAMVAMSPAMLVQKEMMIPYNDGLLPGHVYMLYWIDKIHRSSVPAYFEYEYGINFEAEKGYLQRLGYLDDKGTVTDAGYKVIQNHYEVIVKKHPELNAKSAAPIKNSPDLSRTIPFRDYDSTELIPVADYAQLQSELEFLNKINRSLCRNYKLPRMVIDFNHLCFNTGSFGTHYIFTPLTKTKRPSKYPLSIRYSYTQDGYETPKAFGNIYYLQNGKIGKVEEIFWPKKHEGYVISLGQTKGELVLKYIEHMTPLEGDRKIIVKESK